MRIYFLSYVESYRILSVKFLKLLNVKHTAIFEIIIEISKTQESLPKVFL